MAPVLRRSPPTSGIRVNFPPVFLASRQKDRWLLDDTFAFETQSRKRFDLLDFSEGNFFLETPAGTHLCLMTWADSHARESRNLRKQESRISSFAVSEMKGLTARRAAGQLTSWYTLPVRASPSPQAQTVTQGSKSFQLALSLDFLLLLMIPAIVLSLLWRSQITLRRPPFLIPITNQSPCLRITLPLSRGLHSLLSLCF